MQMHMSDELSRNARDVRNVLVLELLSLVVIKKDL